MPRAAFFGVFGLGAVSALTLVAVAADRPQLPAGMAVTVVKATTERFVELVRVAGTVIAHEEAIVVPDAADARSDLRVKKVSAETGDLVRTGDELVRLTRVGQTGGENGDIVLKAPADGLIFRSAAQVGATAAPAAQASPPCSVTGGGSAAAAMGRAGPEPLFRIAVGGRLDLMTQVPEILLPKIRRGQAAHVDVMGIRDLEGKVGTIPAEIDRDTQSGKVCIELGRNDKLRVGAFGHARIEVDARPGTSVPLSAVIYGREVPIVQVVRADRDGNKVETRPVSVGLISGANAEIRDGLKPGDMVVERAGSFLGEGDRVRPVLAEHPGG